MSDHGHDGWYYLHTNGALIWKKFWPGGDNSPFVMRVWRLDTRDRCTAWKIILESLCLGANINRVGELAEKWHCTAGDLAEYLSRNASPTAEEKKGVDLFLCKIAGYEDPEEFWNVLAKTPKGERPNLPMADQ